MVTRQLNETTLAGPMFCIRCDTSYPSGTDCPADGARLIHMRPALDPLVGRDLDGRFTVIEKLGQGGMGAVYRARQHSVDREVAIKVIHPNLLADPIVIKRFLRESRLSSKLSHPNAVAVLDFGQTEDGLFYLVMELIAGRTLEAAAIAQPVMDARRIVRIGKQVCDALEAAHSLAIVHRDLKPANIMLLDTARDFVKVLDFGLAKSLAVEDLTGSSSAGLNGTPAYVPPERAVGKPGDARSDLYSLGCILYLLGSGTLPFSARSAHDLLVKQVVEPAPPMTGVPPALAAVIDRLLRKDPGARFQSAAETRLALEGVFDDVSESSIRIGMPVAMPVAARAVTASSLLTLPPLERSRWPWIAAIAVLAMLVAMVVAIRGVSAIAAPAEESLVPKPVVAPTATPAARVTPSVPPVDPAAVPASEPTPKPVTPSVTIDSPRVPAKVRATKPPEARTGPQLPF